MTAAQASVTARALIEIRALKKRLAQLHDAVAIVGIGCRLPGAEHDLKTPQSLFDGLLAGNDGIRPIPAERWPAGYVDADRTRAGAHDHGLGRFFCATSKRLIP